ncbi:MAG: hypothetical protein ACKOOI_14095 [Pirellula sp.]
MSIPHRISLSRAWAALQSDVSVLKLQRFFQKPTGICSETVVRLKIESQQELQSVLLNGSQLTGPSLSQRENDGQPEAEKTLNFGYDWDITAILLARNELVVSWPMSDPVPPEPPPKFEVCLEIFAP